MTKEAVMEMLNFENALINVRDNEERSFINILGRYKKLNFSWTTSYLTVTDKSKE